MKDAKRRCVFLDVFEYRIKSGENRVAPMCGINKRSAAVGKPCPQILFRQQPRDRGSKRSSVVRDQHVNAILEVESFDTDRRRYAWSTDHHRLHQLSFRSRAVKEWDDGNSCALQIRHHRGHPSDELHAFGLATTANDRLVRVGTDDVYGMLRKNLTRNFGDDFLAEILDGLDVRCMTKISDKKHSGPLLQRQLRYVRILHIRNRERHRTHDEVVDQVGFFLRNRQNRIAAAYVFNSRIVWRAYSESSVCG